MCIVISPAERGRLLPLGAPASLPASWSCEETAGRDAGAPSKGVSSRADFKRVAHMTMPSLILASGSPRRAELLRQAGVEFEIVPSEVPEIHHQDLTAREVSQINAYRKARSVAKKFPDALVLGADTLVYLDTALFGKPPTLEQAYLMLEQLQGRTHHVVTAICLLHLRGRRQKVFSVDTAVTFRDLDAPGIRKYLTQVNPLDKAGAYAIQEHGDWLVANIAGSYTNVVGLPVESVKAELSVWNASG